MDTKEVTFDISFLQDLKYKTPYFFFSKKKILQNYKKFKELFPGSSVYFAMKANSEPEVLKLLSDLGCGFEVASVFELHMLKKIQVKPAKIIYGTSVKPASQIKEFYKFGVNVFAFDSFPELEKIAVNAPGSKVYVRVVVNDTGSVFKFSGKFGTDSTNVVPMLIRASELGLYPLGISFHVGSQSSDPKAWANAIEGLIPVIKELKKRGIKMEILNIGGGYPCKYASAENAPTLEEISHYTKEQLKKLNHKTKLILEPGRGIIADTAILITTVIAKVERMGTTWLFLDAGVYNSLFEAMAYQGSTRYPIEAMKSADESGEMLFSLAGPTGDSPDIITKEVMLPKNIEVGDKLIIHHTGAYSLVTCSPFNGFPKPDVYFI